MAALLYTQIPGVPEPTRGKVREVYDFGTELLIVASDRLSAFDVIMENGVPDKGRILNQLSAFWFAKLVDICPNHVISTDDDAVADLVRARVPELAGRCTIAVKAKPLPIECVVRGYLAGSLWKDYRKMGGAVHGLNLNAGLRESEKLPEPIFTPATKAKSGHDENISYQAAARLVGGHVLALAKDWSINLYEAAAAHAESKGLILADTKFEFGLTDDGLILIDEALTPDSSRFWQASSWEPGSTPQSFDKQFVRDFLEASGWNKQPPGPLLPDDVIQGTRERYLQAYRLLTGGAPKL